jgi:hypothetical protein
MYVARLGEGQITIAHNAIGRYTSMCEGEFKSLS